MLYSWGIFKTTSQLLFLDIDENVIEVKERSCFLECSVLEQRQTGGQLYFIARSVPVFSGTGQ